MKEEILTDRQAQEQEQAQPTKRELFEKRITDKYPDLDEEGIYTHAINSYDNKKKDLNELQLSSGALIDLMENNPDAIDFFQAAAETGDVEDALLVLPEDVLERALERKRGNEVLSDEEKEQKKNNHKNNIIERREFKKRLKENEPKTLQNIENYAKKRGLKPEEVVERMLPLLKKIQENDLDEEVLDSFFLSDIRSDEYNRGLTDGRNSKIEEKQLTRKTSGLPQPNPATITDRPKRGNGNPFAFMGGED